MTENPRDRNRLRLTAYVVVAIAGLIAGLLLAQLGTLESSGGSRVDWPTANTQK